MSRKRFTPERIIGKLREAEVALAQGQMVGQACRTLRIKCSPLVAPSYKSIKWTGKSCSLLLLYIVNFNNP